MVKSSLKYLFTKLSPALKFINPKGSHLLVLMFHSVLKDEEFSVLQDSIDPGIHISLSQFEEIIQLCQRNGYQFISPKDLNATQRGNFVLLTFDDGYKNNQNIVPILKKYKAPAIVFINGSFIQNQNISPWDLYYFEHRKNGKKREQILKEYAKRPRLSLTFSEGLKPLMPLTEIELQELAKNDEIFIGNHSFSHERHSFFTSEKAINEILSAQKFLENLKIETVKHFAFPEGKINREILPELKKYFDFIHTVDEGINSLDSIPFLLKRYGVNSSQQSEYQMARFTL